MCISPKAGSTVVQCSGDELKLVWPQPADPQAGHSLADMESWDFAHWLVQPLDEAEKGQAHTAACVAFVMAHPRWRLSLQTHKMLGLK